MQRPCLRLGRRRDSPWLLLAARWLGGWNLYSFFRQGKELGFPPAPAQVRPHILWVPRERKATEQALSN